MARTLSQFVSKSSRTPGGISLTGLGRVLSNPTFYRKVEAEISAVFCNLGFYGFHVTATLFRDTDGALG